jgi:lipopolysaccharide transport system permease protein
MTSPAESHAALSLDVAPPAHSATSPIEGVTSSTVKPWLVIEGGKGVFHLDLMDLWRFRDLLVTLATRDLKLRYKQTALGVIWVVLQPLMAAGIFTILFGLIAGLTPADGRVPTFVFMFASMTAWTLFSGTLLKVSSSLVGNSHLISKVYFPRLVLPLSSVGSTLVDFGVSLGMLAALLLVTGVAPGWSILMLPVWILLLIAASMGIGLITSALAVSYRDVNYVLPVFVQLLLYASPIAIDLSTATEKIARLPDKWHWLSWFFYANPLTGLLEAFRWSVLGTPWHSQNWALLAWSSVSSIGLMVAGVYHFKMMERKFADVV